jgi:hypothetical protein
MSAVAVGPVHTPRTAGITVAVKSKPQHPSSDLLTCTRIGAHIPQTRITSTGARFGVASPGLLHPDWCASGDDPGSVLTPDAELVKRIAGTEPGHLQHCEPQRRGRHPGQRERGQLVQVDNRRGGATAGHARADQLRQMRPYRVFVMLAAERPPADMLTRRVVLQSPQRGTARNGTGRTPLAVPFTPPVKSRRPVISGAIYGVGQSEPAGHALKPLMARIVAAGSYDKMTSLLEGSGAGPAFVLVDGAGPAFFSGGEAASRARRCLRLPGRARAPMPLRPNVARSARRGARRTASGSPCAT